MSLPLRRRRTLTGVAAVAVGTFALSACGGGVSDTDAGTGAASAAADFTPATSGEMTLYTWSDYFPEELAAAFEEETGIDLTVDYYDSNETLEAKLRASNGTGYDVVVPGDYMVQILRDSDLLLEIDATSLPNGANIKESFVDPYFDEGRMYTVPYLYGTTGYMYDSAKTDTELTSWADYFNAPASLGPVGTMNDQSEVINSALRATGGTTCTTDPDELQAAQDLLGEFKSQVSTISSEGILDRLAGGEESIAMIWNGAGMRARADLDTLVYVYPTEGLSLWQDNFAVPVGATNVDQALTFLNWMMEPENSAFAANFQRYGSGITGVEEFLDEEMATAPEMNIPEGYEGAQPVEPCTNEELTNYTQIWESFKG